LCPINQKLVDTRVASPGVVDDGEGWVSSIWQITGTGWQGLEFSFYNFTASCERFNFHLFRQKENI